MNDHELRDAYEVALKKGEAARPLDLPLERLEALVSGEGTEAERLRSIDVLMSSAEGRREFEVAWAAARAAREREKKPMTTLLSWRRSALATAAVLFVAATVVWVNSREDRAGELMRGEESPVQLLSPEHDNVSSSSVQFTWRPVATARNYLLVVVDTAGGDVFASSTTDTSVTLPDSVRLAPGGEYLWWVQATLPDGATLSAVTERFRVKR
jgi:hypothetical protein